MKLMTILLTAIISQTTFAHTEGISLKCSNETKRGDIVSIEGCMDSDAENFVACGDDGVAYITVSKETWPGVTMSPPIMQSMKIPAQSFVVDRSEEHLALSYYDRQFGAIDLLHVFASQNADSSMTVRLKAFNNTSKGFGDVSCATVRTQ